MLPVYSVRDVPGLYRRGGGPLPLGFSQVLILNLVKVLCFDTLLQVLILKVVSREWMDPFSVWEKAREPPSAGRLNHE